MPHHRKKTSVIGDSVEDVAEYIVQHNVKNILVLVGAGISVAAGIPDFRSPNTGIYAQLEKYNLDEPSDAFSIDLLREHPHIFYSIAQEMDLWPGRYKPTRVHHFIKLLADKGLLLRCCTQNIDGLEGAAGLSAEHIVEAHGSFRTSSCIDCHLPYDTATNKKEAFDGLISRCPECGGIVKPDVVFFGEQLPPQFFEVLVRDTQSADMVMILGTSLQVHPFAALPHRVRLGVPRIVINRERVGGRVFHFPTDMEPAPSSSSDAASSDGGREGGTSTSSSDGMTQYGEFERPALLRDLFFPGDCQEVVLELAKAMGLEEELAAGRRIFGII
ncbi:NAD-dependent SIR2 [Strigomonas culicis]|uniref:NAD-dependent protein deacetylase n=1 Tax=Strigomonas culicis TaxID=28005 RepID=S9V000_9TRYP|nr:NAD-dependent SIR2 [Strigomonas culicis]|eukprot:EPY36437.1 NAD-dependent SIR2 [Strigomonas culicis]